MSTCPTKEIHSLYLDNELPQNHREQYEAHIEGCDKCRKELERLRAVRALFQKDDAAITPDKAFMDASYERLLLKMNYSKNAGRSSYSKFSLRSWKIIVPAAAALVLLALAIPLKFAAGRSGVKTMSATSSIYSKVPSTVSEQLENVAFDGEKIFGSSAQSAKVTNVSNVSAAASKLIQDVEVFRPMVEGTEKTISIRITVPGNDDVPVTTEIEVPLDVTGQF